MVASVGKSGAKSRAQKSFTPILPLPSPLYLAINAFTSVVCAGTLKSCNTFANARASTNPTPVLSNKRRNARSDVATPRWSTFSRNAVSKPFTECGAPYPPNFPRKAESGFVATADGKNLLHESSRPNPSFQPRAAFFSAASQTLCACFFETASACDLETSPSQLSSQSAFSLRTKPVSNSFPSAALASVNVKAGSSSPAGVCIPHSSNPLCVRVCP